MSKDKIINVIIEIVMLEVLKNIFHPYALVVLLLLLILLMLFIEGRKK